MAARAQLANISAFTDTITNVNTTIGVMNTSLQALVDGAQTVHDALVLNSTTISSSGQTNAQQIAAAQLGSMLGILNTQSGGRYVFSGAATDTPSVASMDDILNGTVTQAGLKQVIAERQAADLGTGSMARLAVSTPTVNFRCADRRWFSVRTETQFDHVFAHRLDRRPAGRRAAG